MMTPPTPAHVPYHAGETCLDLSRGAPLWLGPSHGPLFGWLHGPASDRVRALVLLCPSLAREQIAAYAAYRELADKLALAGFAVLRFDYYGTGDSAGEVSGGNAISACEESIQFTANWLREACPAPLIVVGLRLGATLVVSSIRNGGIRPDGLVLWDPAKSGRLWLRHQTILQRLYIGSPGEPDLAGVQLPGFRFDPAAAKAISSLRLGDIDTDLASRVLFMRGDGLGAVQVSSSITTADGEAQNGFLDVSTVLATLPTATTRKIVRWCEEMFDPADHPLTCVRSSSADVPLSNGAAIRERVVELGSSDVFGLISEPIGPARGPTAVFLNVASEHHIGPSRMWVELAREWASLGLRTVRVDLSGLGDSPSAPGQQAGLAFPSSALADMRQIANALSPNDPAGLVWLGICSGGYHALEAAAAIGAVGAFVVNPTFTIVPPEGRLRGQDSWRRLCCVIPAWARNRSETDKRPLRPTRDIRGLFYFCLYELGLRSAPAAGLRLLNRYNKQTTIVSGPDEAKPLLRFRCARMSGRYTNLQLHVIADLEHALLYAPQRKEVAAMATAWMTTRASAEP